MKILICLFGMIGLIRLKHILNFLMIVKRVDEIPIFKWCNIVIVLMFEAFNQLVFFLFFNIYIFLSQVIFVDVNKAKPDQATETNQDNPSSHLSVSWERERERERERESFFSVIEYTTHKFVLVVLAQEPLHV